jgi:hypothetical protein
VTWAKKQKKKKKQGPKRSGVAPEKTVTRTADIKKLFFVFSSQALPDGVAPWLVFC